MHTLCTPKFRFVSALIIIVDYKVELKEDYYFHNKDVSLKWSDEEGYGLVLFLLLHTDGKTWVAWGIQVLVIVV